MIFEIRTTVIGVALAATLYAMPSPAAGGPDLSFSEEIIGTDPTIMMVLLKLRANGMNVGIVPTQAGANGFCNVLSFSEARFFEIGSDHFLSWIICSRRR